MPSSPECHFEALLLEEVDVCQLKYEFTSIDPEFAFGSPPGCDCFHKREIPIFCHNRNNRAGSSPRGSLSCLSGCCYKVPLQSHVRRNGSRFEPTSPSWWGGGGSRSVTPLVRLRHSQEAESGQKQDSAVNRQGPPSVTPARLHLLKGPQPSEPPAAQHRVFKPMSPRGERLSAE